MGLQATSPPTSPLHRPPPPLNAKMLKRKHDVIEDDMDDEDVLMAVTTGSGVKKICVEVVRSSERESKREEQHRVLNNSDEDIEDFSSEDSDDASAEEAQTSSDEERLEESDSIMVTSSNDSSSHSDEENKENHSHVNKLDSILAKTLLNSTNPQVGPVNANNTNLMTGTPTTSEVTSALVNNVKNDNESQPKVIVEHKPLPSIYDLQQMSAACDNLDDNNTHSNTSSHSSTNSSQMLNNCNNQGKENDSGVSDDEDSEGDEVSDIEGETEDEDEDENDHPSPSPIFDPVLRGTNTKPLMPSPPKAIYDHNRSFWSNQQQQQQQHNQNGYSQPQPNGQQQHGQNQNTFQFLEQNTQRIECAENGKSYLQLGTMNAAHSHHHLPVTPVIQPKPNMVYRRPIPPFRNHLSSTNPTPISHPRPVCDHSNCLQKKSSFCYQSQRSRMLSLSLSKLHMARQSHDGSLRRSVLICNMLRYIEDETDREAINERDNCCSQYNNQQQQQQQQQPGVPMDQTEVPHGVQPPQVQGPPQAQPQPQYWTPTSVTMSSTGPPTVSTQAGNPSLENGQIYNMPTNPNQAPPQSFNSREMEVSYETTLKDFNSAFRSTPYSSPAHPGTEMDSGLGDDDRGINWSSVLSLSSQSELDPLNNNTFATEAWPNTANTPTTLSSVPQLTDISSSTVTSLTRPSTPAALSMSDQTSTIVTSTTNTVTSFDDIGWKLSADDVLKAFPNDENLFSVGTAGPWISRHLIHKLQHPSLWSELSLSTVIQSQELLRMT